MSIERAEALAEQCGILLQKHLQGRRFVVLVDGGDGSDDITDTGLGSNIGTSRDAVIVMGRFVERYVAHFPEQFSE